MRKLFFCFSLAVLPAMAAAQPDIATSGTATTPADAMLTRTLGDFLKPTERPAGPDLTSFYAEIPPSLEPGVRYFAADNHTSAAAAFLQELPKAADSKEKARVNMWLGVLYGQQAIDYPSMGWQLGTSATTHLFDAQRLDPSVFEAPEVARIMAEMVAHGWGNEDPATALDRAEKKAEETRRAVDFYYAGQISRRLAQRAWSYSDTTEQDKRTLSLLAKAVARESGRYESWPPYLNALMPVGLHDLATTEAKKMYEHFQNLRTPLMSDQGPSMVFLSTSSYRTMQMDEDFITSTAQKWPDAPWPPFEMAMRAIETTPTMAMELFPEFVKRIESGSIKLLPREQGYHPSALYKIAFLQQQNNLLKEATDTYRKLLEISPTYAEANGNLGIVYAQMSEGETTGPTKLELLEQALVYITKQEKLDYRGKAALKAAEIRQRLRSTLFHLKQELAGKGKEDTTTTGTK